MKTKHEFYKLFTMISALIVLTWFISIPASSQEKHDTTNCYPACRSGYICIDGVCVSRCNPPCPEGQECNAKGECVTINKNITYQPVKTNTSSNCKVKLTFNVDNATLYDKNKIVICSNLKEYNADIPNRMLKTYFVKAPHAITQFYSLRCIPNQNYLVDFKLKHVKPELAISAGMGIGLEEGFLISTRADFGLRTRANYTGIVFDYGHSEETIFVVGLADKIYINTGRSALLVGLTAGYFSDNITVHGATFSGIYLSPSLQFRICRSSGLSYFLETRLNTYYITNRNIYKPRTYEINQYDEPKTYVRGTFMTFGIAYTFGKSIIVRNL